MNMSDIPTADVTFSSVHAALTFAFNYSSEQYSPSMLARLLAGPPVGNGKGLAGLNGAGQAGLLLSAVVGLGRPRSLVLAARFSPHAMPCTCGNLCCRLSRPSYVWSAAVWELADDLLDALQRRTNNQRLRHGLVARYFGESISMSKIAEHANVTRETATEHYAVAVPWLKRQENSGMHELEDEFKSTGVIV